mgnify:FL=1
MSKLYKRYLEFKKSDSSTFYLFKSGIFYIFLQEDAIKMSQLLQLKLTNLNETVIKCGFPVNNFNKYLEKIKSLEIPIAIIDSPVDPPMSSSNYLLNGNVKNLINDLAIVDSTSLSISEVYALIDNLSLRAKEIAKEMKN